MLFFGKKKEAEIPSGTYDPQTQAPVLRCSICTGEKVAGFQDRNTGHFSEIMLIRTDSDLDRFRRMYGITEEIRRIY